MVCNLPFSLDFSSPIQPFVFFVYLVLWLLGVEGFGREEVEVVIYRLEDLWTNSKEGHQLGRGFLIPFHICNCRLHVCYVIGPNYPRDIKLSAKFVQVVGGYFRSFAFQKLPVLFLIMVKNRSAPCVWRLPQSLPIFILELYYHLSDLKMFLWFFSFISVEIIEFLIN